VPVGEPWRVAYQDINAVLSAAQPDGPHEIADVVTPDVVTVFVVQAAQRAEALGYGGLVFRSDSQAPVKRREGRDGALRAGTRGQLGKFVN
jgi:hypothetical protein